MAKEKDTNDILSIDAQIKAEQGKIKKLFKNIGKEKRAIIDKQISELAFLQVTLNRLKNEVNNGEILEDFEQGSQKFKRENSALKSYNATIKSYITVTKTLLELLPPTDKEIAGQALMSFVAAPKKAR